MIWTEEREGCRKWSLEGSGGYTMTDPWLVKVKIGVFREVCSFGRLLHKMAVLGGKKQQKKQTTFAHLEYGKDIDSMEVAQCVLAVNVRTSGTKEWSPYLNVCHGSSDRITMDLRRWVCGKRGCRVENAPPPTRLRTRFWCLSRLQRVDRRVDQVQIGKLCSILEIGVPDTSGLVPN